VFKGISDGKELPPALPIFGRLAGKQEGAELFLQKMAKKGIVWAFLGQNNGDFGIQFIEKDLNL
jgi:hypothetical protein